MDPNHRIYEDDPDKIPDEDKARLDGYLKSRAEADVEARMEELKRDLARAQEQRLRDLNERGTVPSEEGEQ